MDGYRREMPRAAVDAIYEARRAGLCYVIVHHGNELSVVLYAYNRVVGTVHVHERTLVFPDQARPVVRDIYPADAVRAAWEDCRWDNPPAEPIEAADWWRKAA